MIELSAWKPRAAALSAVAALVWAVSLYGLLVDEGLVYAFAVVPRRLDGLSGIGRSAAHVGASGLIFGYFGFLVGRGYYERSLRSIAVAVLVAVVYGGMIAGVLPQDDRVSWEAHLFGLLAGGVCARLAPGRPR